MLSIRDFRDRGKLQSKRAGVGTVARGSNYQQMVFGRNSDRGSCGITNRLNWHLLRKHFTGVVVVVVVIVVVVEVFHWKGYGGKDDDKVTEVRFTPGMK